MSDTCLTCGFPIVIHQQNITYSGPLCTCPEAPRFRQWANANPIVQPPFWSGQILELQAQLTEARNLNESRGIEIGLLKWGSKEVQAKLARAQAALEKIKNANCPTYCAHPQSVWWEIHVQSIAKAALEELGKG